MTCKIKRRSLRCGGRPKADFGSIFNTFIAPALGVAGSVADSAIAKHQVNKVATTPDANTQIPEPKSNPEPKVDDTGNNGTTVLPPDPTKTPTMRLGGRKKCWIGAAIMGATSIAGSLFGAAAQKREMRRQKSIKDWQNTTQEAANMTTALNNSQDYQEDYLRQFRTAARLGKTLGAKGIYITDGGDATKIGNNTYLLRGGSHEDVNETGQTGIGINVGGNEVEAEGGEVAQKKNGALRIFSAQPILSNGMSPAQAILRGYNKDKVFSQQQAFKKRNGLKDDGSKAAFGNLITMPFAGIVKDVVDYFSNSGKYAPKRVKVSNKTVNRKPIRNGQVGNFRVVNGKYFPNEKPLRQVYPEFDIISMGRGLPIKRSLKNTVGFVQKPNTFTRGIGNREGIKDLVESKVVRGNPVGTEMTAKAYTKATKSNRNSFNDIMNSTGIEGISHRYYNRSLSKEDFDAIRESYNKINASFKARHSKASGKIRFAINDDVYDPLGNYKNYDDYLAQIASDRKTLRNATTINPDNGEPIAYFYNDGRNPLTQGHGYASSKWGVRISNPQDYNMKIFDGHLHYSNSKTIPFDSPNVEVFRSTPFGTIRYPKWMLRRGWYRNGGLTSKDRGSSKHPYPFVSSKDFAGSGRSYPIPTKADAVDALRLAGLHGRSDVKAKVYSRYPEFRKKARDGAKIEPYYDWARNTSSNLGISFIDPDYDYRAYYNSVTPYERALIRFAPKETHFTDIGKTPKHATFSNESKYSNNKTPGGTWNGNVFVPNIWQFGNNGNNRRNKYMNNSGEGYFNGRVNIFPTSRKRHSLGGCSRPVKGMRPKAATGIFVPYNKRYTSIYDAPDYNSDYNGGNVLGNGEVTITAKRIKPTFMKPNNDAMNLIKVPKEEEVPYIPQRHNRSRTIFSGGDYLGLGIDTLAALSTGLVNYNTAGKYTLPDRAPIIQASKLPTTYNVNPEIEEVKRYRDRLTGQTFNNTSSSVAALNRSGAINLDALSNLSKLWATKENEENKMLTEDAKNQQTVAAQNVQNELARQSEIARIKNEATQAKGDALNVGLSGLSQAWTNFWTAGRTAYEDDQSRRAMIASSKDATPTRLMEFDFDLSPDVIASLYRGATEDRTKRFYLSRLSPKQRQKYGIN